MDRNRFRTVINFQCLQYSLNRKEFWPFEKARDYVRKLGLKTNSDWRRFTKSGKLPKEIPIHPSRDYRNKGWISSEDWLGSGYVLSRSRKYYPYFL